MSGLMEFLQLSATHVKKQFALARNPVKPQVQSLLDLQPPHFRTGCDKDSSVTIEKPFSFTGEITEGG